MTDVLDTNTELVVRRWNPEIAAQVRASLLSNVLSKTAEKLVLHTTKNGTAELNLLVRELFRADAKQTIASVLAGTSIDHACARIKLFGNYKQDWDGEGAAAPKSELLNAALRFLRRLQPWHPTPSATLDAEGQPVIEFRDAETSLFGKVRFVASDRVEIFAVTAGEEDYCEGDLSSVDVLRFLSDCLQITLRP